MHMCSMFTSPFSFFFFLKKREKKRALVVSWIAVWGMINVYWLDKICVPPFPPFSLAVRKALMGTAYWGRPWAAHTRTLPHQWTLCVRTPLLRGWTDDCFAAGCQPGDCWSAWPVMSDLHPTGRYFLCGLHLTAAAGWVGAHAGHPFHELQTGVQAAMWEKLR